MLPSLSRWLSSGKYFDFNGHGIFYKKEDTGKKEWILLIHGFPTASYDYAPVWAALAKKYNLITADLLGYGFSSKPRNYSYSIIQQADILEGYLGSIGDIKPYGPENASPSCRDRFREQATTQLAPFYEMQAFAKLLRTRFGLH